MGFLFLFLGFFLSVYSNFILIECSFLTSKTKFHTLFRNILGKWARTYLHFTAFINNTILAIIDGLIFTESIIFLYVTVKEKNRVDVTFVEKMASIGVFFVLQLPFLLISDKKRFMYASVSGFFSVLLLLIV